MSIERIVEEIDAEITRLVHVKNVLHGSEAHPRADRQHHSMSPEARAKIGAAVKARWLAKNKNKAK